MCAQIETVPNARVRRGDRSSTARRGRERLRAPVSATMSACATPAAALCATAHARHGYRRGMDDAGTVEVWRADLDSAFAGGEAEGLLSDDERDRAAAMRGERARARWVASRAVLRRILGEYASVDPRTLVFELGPLGKPALARLANAAADRSRLCFNASHSGPLALYAVTRSAAVGVDVELADRRRPSDAIAIARRLLGEDVAERLRRLPERLRDDAFLREWTAHEARIKCLGLSLGLAAERDEETRSRLAALWLTELDSPIDAFAALAVDGPAMRIEHREWAAQSNGSSSAISASLGAEASRGETVRSMPLGHSIPMSGSSQAMPRSSSGS
jgi:4'-phosphopantetheinyl transferase